MTAADQTHYELLGVSPTASDEEIKRAWLQAVRAWHPDVNDSTAATRMTQRLNAAHHVLSNPERRARYDLTLRQAGKLPRTVGRPPRPQARTATGTPSTKAARDAAAARRAQEEERVHREREEERRQRAEEARERVEARRRQEEAERRRAEERAREEQARAEQRRHEKEERARLAAEEAERRAQVLRAMRGAPLAWDDDRFVVGRWYGGNGGPFEVLDASGDQVTVRSQGVELKLPARVLWAQWQEHGRAAREADGLPWADRPYQPPARQAVTTGAFGPEPAPAGTAQATAPGPATVAHDERPPTITVSGAAARPDGFVAEALERMRGELGDAEAHELRRAFASMTRADDVLRFLAQRGWGALRERRAGGGRLWFMPTARRLSAFSRLVAALNKDHPEYALRFASNEETGNRPAWYLGEPIRPGEGRFTRPSR